jgi:hypothetical protein
MRSHFQTQIYRWEKKAEMKYIKKTLKLNILTGPGEVAL